MSEWQCSHCEKKFTFEEFIKLQGVPLVELDEKLGPEHGNTMVCPECDKPFHFNKWALSKTMRIPGFVGWWFKKIRISTVHLELNHFGNYYETMIFQVDSFWGNPINIGFQVRHPTKIEAMNFHNNLIERIKNKDFIFNTKTGELEL